MSVMYWIAGALIAGLLAYLLYALLYAERF
jgi:K+-transporting ATPase KdpF subunit